MTLPHPGPDHQLIKVSFVYSDWLWTNLCGSDFMQIQQVVSQSEPMDLTWMGGESQPQYKKGKEKMSPLREENWWLWIRASVETGFLFSQGLGVG